MAKVGLKHVVAAKLKEDGTTYDKGFVVGKAMKASVTAESNDVKLYADDGVAESDKSFKGGKISIGVDDLTNKSYADLLGHTYTEATADEPASPETVIASGDDIAPYMGVGFYGKIIRDNKPSYMAKWLKKVQFAEPADETETKGETVAFQTPTIEGDVFKMNDGTWKEQAEFTNETDAVKWLDTKAGITTGA